MAPSKINAGGTSIKHPQISAVTATTARIIHFACRLASAQSAIIYGKSRCDIMLKRRTAAATISMTTAV